LPKRISNGSMAHHAGKDAAADDQAQAETEAALNAKLNRRLVDAFRRAQQVAAVHPRRRHRQRGDPERHLPAGDNQIGGSAATHLARREPADSHEGAVHGNNRGDRC
jgi:hypothetical protein